MSEFDSHSSGLPYNPTDVDVRRQTFSIEMIFRMIERGKIELKRRLEYQRKFTKWSLERRSRLIESLIMRIPLPMFYFDGSTEPWKVIDGIHRLSAFFDFFKDEYQLENLQYFSELNGKKYSELPFRYQRVIEEATIEAYLINPGTPEDVKYNIFQRINTGGTPLTAQEIRNAFYLKEANEFLNNLVESNSFKKATDGRILSNRGRAQEVILRCIALFEYLDKYQRPMEKFLDYTMKALDHLPSGYKHEIQERFENSFDICYQIFERKTFRLLDQNGDILSNHINVALLEAFVVNIAHLSRMDALLLINRRFQVYDLSLQLFQDRDFRVAITSATTSKKAVALRHEMVYSLIQHIIHANRT